MLTATIDSAETVGTIAPDMPAPVGVHTLNVLLIKPSKYDDDGYVMRFFRGVLPSNTLATLAALTHEAATRRALGDVKLRTIMMDEIVQKIEPARLVRRYTRGGARLVVALCGVQTNQFPRAADMALEFKAAGAPVMIGGFHVSGAIAMSPNGIPPECQALIDAGVTLVKGEVEECWADLLRDALHDQLRPYYDIHARPDLSKAAIPMVEPRVLKKFAYPRMGTIDAGRGCPFNCSFCTIINVQGRSMRCRDAEAIKARIRSNAAKKIDWYFFTDDNFARNPNWEAIFDALIALRREEQLDIQFMMQVDTQSYRIKNFMDKAAEAGCSQVFIGMETINPANIPAAGKKQNRVEDYAKMIEAWHGKGIACHVGYIIGFPFDSVESVRDDVRRLHEEVQVDQASFFMLTPLPGSRDHQEMVQRGDWMDEDYNRFDSFHPTTHHPLMSAAQWWDVYREAWRTFYTTDRMKTILTRANDFAYWGLFKNFVWYKYAALIEDTHPMICGFLRLKDRLQRRPGYAVEHLPRHAWRRARELAHVLRESMRLYFEMQEVWLATRGRVRMQAGVDRLRQRYGDAQTSLTNRANRAREAFAELRRSGGETMAAAAERVSLPWRVRLNPFALRTPTRQDLDAYWQQTAAKLRRGRIYAINPLRLGLNALRDVKLCAYFNIAFLLGYTR